MTRSEDTRRVLAAWDGEPCPRDGNPMRTYHWTDDDEVIAHCPSCDRDYWVARERHQDHYDPEPDGGDELPF